MHFKDLEVYGFKSFAEKTRVIYAILLGLMLALLALSRPEGVFFYPFFVFWFFVLPYIRRFRTEKILSFWTILKKQIWGLVLIVVLFFVICLPQLLYIYHDTGFPFTEKRVAEAIMSKIDFSKNKEEGRI